MEWAGILELAKLIGNYGIGIVCLAVLIIEKLHNSRVVLPNMAAAHQKQMIAVMEAATRRSEESEKRIEKLVIAFREEVKAEREQCHEDHEKMFSALMTNQVALNRVLERLVTKE